MLSDGISMLSIGIFGMTLCSLSCDFDVTILETGTTGTFTPPLRVAETFPVPKGEPFETRHLY